MTFYFQRENKIMELGMPFFSTFGVELYYISYLSRRFGGANTEQVGREVGGLGVGSASS